MSRGTKDRSDSCAKCGGPVNFLGSCLLCKFNNTKVNRHEILVEHIRKLKLKNLPNTEIARTLGVSETTVRYNINEEYRQRSLERKKSKRREARSIKGE